MKNSSPGGVLLRLLAIVSVALLIAFACSDSTAPEEPAGGGGGNPYTDVPPIPEPSTPGGETGTLSDTVTVIGPLTTNYRPMVRSAFCAWGVRTRCCTRILFPPITDCTNWVALVGMQPTWSDGLPELNITGCAHQTLPPPPVSIARPDPWQRFLLMEDGILVEPEPGGSGVEVLWAASNGMIEESAQCELFWQPRTAETAPHVRRDRFWVRKQLEGGAGNFLLLIGDTQGEISTTYTSGSSTTETEEFGRSVTASAGLSLGALSLGVSVTLSETFSTSVTVSEETSETFTKTVFGEDGKTVHFQVWELVEYYTITDADGKPFTDPNYTVELSDFHIRGVGVALVATKFDS
jgi:hypothetical protein